jgi:hypothetical protein
MRTALILLQVGFLSTLAVLGAHGSTAEKAACPLPAATAQHCEVAP